MVRYRHSFNQSVHTRLKSETENKTLPLEKNIFLSASIRELSSVFFHQLNCIQKREVLNFKVIIA